MALFGKRRRRPRRRTPTVGRRSVYDHGAANSRTGVRGPDGKKYDALATWLAGVVPPDASVLRALRGLRSASRVEAARGGYLRAAVLTLRREVVGSGLVLRCQHESSDVRQAVESAWKAWARKPDITGQLSFRAMLHRVVSSIVIDGEALLLDHVVDGQYRIELLDAMRLDIEKNDERTSMGVVKDALHRPTGYWLLERERVDSYGTYGTDVRHLVPSTRLMHVFDADLPEQTRGVPWAFSTLRRFEDLRRYDEAEREASILASNIYATHTPPEDGGELSDDEQSSDSKQDVRPGEVIELEPGAAMNFHTPQHPNTAYGDFVQTNLAGAAASLGISYASLTGDLSRANFTASRMGRLAERGTVMLLRDLIVEGICQRIYGKWLMTAMLNGDLPNVPMDDLETVDFVGPAMEHVQPREAADADHLRLEDGLASRAELIRESGRDPQAVLAEIAQEHTGEQT